MSATMGTFLSAMINIKTEEVVCAHLHSHEETEKYLRAIGKNLKHYRRITWTGGGVDDLKVQGTPNEDVKYLRDSILRRWNYVFDLMGALIEKWPVKKLFAANLKLARFRNVPEGVQILDCSSNELDSLPALPKSLRTLYASHNPMRVSPRFPPNLKELFITHTELDELAPLPEGLEILDCSHGKLKRLPPLPKTLQRLYCHHNQITERPKEQPGMYQVDYSDNPIVGPSAESSVG